MMNQPAGLRVNTLYYGVTQKPLRVVIRALLATGIALFFSYLYLDASQKQSPNNSKLLKNDQIVYMDIAKQAYETRFQYTGNRNQMPLYPFIQALFYSPQLDDEAFFQQGKWLNVVLSLLCLLALGIAFFIKFSKIYAFYSLLVIAFLVFAIKSPWFQVEILFYTLFGFAFMLSLEAIISPAWYKSIGVGVLFALAHLSKASAMIGLFIFISSYGILFLHKLFCRSLNGEEVRRILYHALTPLAVFMILLFPYFQESKERYGSYFYNVNTTFYMWYDTWREANNGTRAAGDHTGWPKLPDEEIPSLSKYLNEHSLSDIISRFRLGAKRFIWAGCNDQFSPFAYGYCNQVVLNVIIVSVCLLFFAVFRGWRVKSSYKNMQAAWWILLFFGLYVLSFTWYVPISSRVGGVRMFLALVIPLLWAVGLVGHAPRMQSFQFMILRRPVKVFHIAYLLMILTVFYELYLVAAFRAAVMYGGA